MPMTPRGIPEIQSAMDGYEKKFPANRLLASRSAGMESRQTLASRPGELDRNRTHAKYRHRCTNTARITSLVLRGSVT
jgi:hypothetical protein